MQRVSRGIALVMVISSAHLWTSANEEKADVEKLPLLEYGLEGNAESLLALGQKMPLSEIDLYDLELLPGVADTLGNAILAKRENLLRIAGKLPERERSQVFEYIKGVGKKNRTLLERSIALR